MSQDPSAARMMTSLQNTQSPVAQQYLSPTPNDQPQSDPSTVSDVPITSPEPSVTETSASEISDQQKLALFENVLQEVENQPQQSEQPPQPVGASKERIEGGQQVASQELPGGMQYVENEPNPEIPPEVENYLEYVQEKQQKMPQEIVEAAQQYQAENASQVPTQPVKVLPISKEVAEEGKKKNTSFAVRWLVVFSNKISQLFAGKSVYRTD